jgi:UDP-N-acetylmuramoyl-tripeptide--D-alanyl-D-alanine ligase
VLLNVGQAHIGVFGSQQAIFQAKGEIFNHLRPKGLALVGAAEPRLAQMATGRRVLTFGRESGDFHAERITLDAEGRQRFDGIHQGVRLALHSGLPGPRGCEPVLAAWAVARELGVPDAVVAERAGQPPRQKGRLRLFEAPGGAALIDDAYNASPETVVNLIETLNDRPERVKVVVLGPLAELEEGLAETAARIAASLGPPLSRCIVYDPVSSQLFDGLERAGTRVALEMAGSQAELFAALKALDAPDTVVGIKGSRSAHMERAVQAMLGTQVACRLHPCALLRYCTDCDDLTGI